LKYLGVKVIDIKCHRQQYFSYIVAVTFVDGGIGIPGKTTELPQVTNKFYHISLYWIHFDMGGNQAHSSGDILEINVRENRMGNKQWIIQRHWQHCVHKTQKIN